MSLSEKKKKASYPSLSLNEKAWRGLKNSARSLYKNEKAETAWRHKAHMKNNNITYLPIIYHCISLFLLIGSAHEKQKSSNFYERSIYYIYALHSIYSLL